MGRPIGGWPADHRPKKGEPGWKSRANARPEGGWPSDRVKRKATKPPTKFERGEFIGWDGEAIDGRYVTLIASTGDELVRPAGIATDEALAFLIKVACKHPHAVHCFFGGNYDFNQIVGDLERPDAERLWAGDFVRRGRFTLQLRPRKSLLVREWDTRTRKWRSVTLWDCIGFFQCSFLAALESYFSPAELALLDIAKIEEGKARRSQFTPEELDFMTLYTRAEVRALVMLMARLRGYLIRAGLPVQRWDGAGAVAASLLRREGMKEHIADGPHEVEHAARHAYSGGRMELLRYGRHAKEVWRYDVNSAYPDAARHLPSLAGAQWVRHEPCGECREGFALVRVRWHLAMRKRGAVECFPFFYREAHGDICYPPSGEGWCWEIERARAEELLRSGVYVGTIEVLDSWCCHPATVVRPFAFLERVYTQRQEWKAAGVGAEKVLKLGANSCYGKLAQQVGYDAASGKRPPFQSMLYAGYITARTRARMLEVAHRDLSAVVMFATDGLFTTHDLGLPPSSDLGGWTVERCDAGIIVAQSGVYWTRSHLAAPLDFATAEHEYRRGFDPGSLSSDAVIGAWRVRARELAACCDHPAEAHTNRWGDQPVGMLGDQQCSECRESHAFRDGPRATRFVTLGSALADGEPTFKLWRSWRTIARDLRLDVAHTKRERIGARGRPDLGLLETRARVVPPPGQHMRYDQDDNLIFACPPECTGSWPYMGGTGWQAGQVDGVDEREFEAELADAEV